MVVLSGGELGGTEYAADGWAIGDTRTISGLIYRRVSETQAVFVGAE